MQLTDTYNFTTGSKLVLRRSGHIHVLFKCGFLKLATVQQGEDHCGAISIKRAASPGDSRVEHSNRQPFYRVTPLPGPAPILSSRSHIWRKRKSRL